ncbi:MAG: LacI family DNA-binding transcriptional regulator [Proteobacteria bacterium]|nr:LacI family DNA-binding transcriptional regulator [Pseudomonadota bacterium]
MPRPIGIHDVAKKAGVAASSVSRVISGHPNVSPEMKERVLTAAAALGYEPNILAQGLRRGSTQTIGLVVPDISNPLFSELVFHAENTLNAAGYALLIANSQGVPGSDITHIKLLRQRVDGFLLSLSDETDAQTASALKELDKPFVLLDRDIAKTKYSSVLWDHGSGIKAAATHLADLGHRRIAMIDGNPRVHPTRARSLALQTAFEDRPEVHLAKYDGAFTPDHGERTTDFLLGGENAPTAIIAGSVQILIGVLRCLRRRKLRVPDDLSLVTIDHAPMLEFIDPPLATIDRDCGDFGRAAAQLLLDRLEGRTTRKRPLPVNFDPKSSCAPPMDKARSA